MTQREFAERIQGLDETSKASTTGARAVKNESISDRRVTTRLFIALIALVVSGIMGFKAAGVYRENSDVLGNLIAASSTVETTIDQTITVVAEADAQAGVDGAPKKTITGEFAKQLLAPKRHLRASTYLPSGEEQWTRLTTSDVRDWDSMEQIRMYWDEQKSAVHWSDLKGLSKFIETERTGFANGHESAAIYFKPNGHIIELRISFLSKSKPGFGQEFENHQLMVKDAVNKGGLDPINLYGLEFARSALNYQANLNFSANTMRRQSFDIHTYLTPTVKISLTGHATVEEIEGLLGGLDYDTLNTLEVH